MPIISGGGGGSGAVSPPVVLAGTDPATIPLSVQGAALQTQDVFEATDSTQTFGVLVFSDYSVQMETPDASSNPSLYVTRQSASNVALFSDAMVTFGGNNAAATSGTRFDHNGAMLCGRTAAPADAALGNSQFSLWLDATPGATKLMVKAKDSGGTVRTAAIALT